MAEKTCRFAIRDGKGVEHALRVSADSLYEAVAKGIAEIRYREWVEDLSLDSGTVKVTVLSEARVDHTVDLADFQKWLSEKGVTSPRDMIQRSKVKEIRGEVSYVSLAVTVCARLRDAISLPFESGFRNHRS
jgi:hypothetical protein